MDQQFDAATAFALDDDASREHAEDAEHGERAGDWFAISRKMLTHPIVGMDVKGPKPADPARKAATPFEAWSFIIASAAFRQRVVTDRRSGATYQLDPGQLVASKRYLARKFNWSEKAALLFIKRLEANDMLTVSKGPEMRAQRGAQRGAYVANVLTVRNYGKYQTPQRSKGTTFGKKKGQQRNNVSNTTSLTLRDGSSGFDGRKQEQRQRIAEPSADGQLQPWQNPEGLALLERTQLGAVARMVRQAVRDNRGQWPAWRLGPAPGTGEDSALFAYLSADELARWAPKDADPADEMPGNVVPFAPRAGVTGRVSA